MSSAVSAETNRPGAPVPTSSLDRFFHITERGSTVAREIRGGLVTFFTMAYIVVLNPLILGKVQDGSKTPILNEDGSPKLGADGMPLFDGGWLGGTPFPDNLPLIAAATALVAGVVTILMGLFANYPLALAAGLGLNAFVAFSIAALPGMTWADAMGLVVIEGLIILLLVLTGFRQAVFHAIPAQLKIAISVGLGLFITLVGLYDAGIVRKAPATPVELGVGGFLAGWPTLVFVVGLVAIIVMMIRKVNGAILYGIVGATVLAMIVEATFDLGDQFSTGNPTAWGLNVPEFPSTFASVPDLSLLGNFNLLGSWSSIGVVTTVLLIFTLMLADFFDTMGTMVAVGAEGGLLDEEGNPPHSDRILVVDSIAASAGGMGGVSSNTSYIESAAGVGEGARTGLSSIVVGVLFLLATFLSPLVEVIPYEAATPALVVVGFLMMQQVSGIDWRDVEIAIPAFLTIVLMPFTYSITAGIGAGFLAYVVVKLAKGKTREIHPLMWITALLFVVYFCMDPIKGLLL